MYINKLLNSQDLLSSTNFLKTYMPLIIMIMYMAVYIMFIYKGNKIGVMEYI